jgi:hypothetical protein
MVNLTSLIIMLCCLLGYTLFNIWLVVVFFYWLICVAFDIYILNLNAIHGLNYFKKLKHVLKNRFSQF